MADVFISYASEDREAAQSLVEVLQAQGWEVWWDRELKPGPEYDVVIQRELRAARCVVVLWSAHSVGSRWVKAEADDAAQRDVLVPAMLESADIPLGFRMLQAADLTDWEGGTDTPAIRAVVESVRAAMRRSRREITAVKARPRLSRVLAIAAVAVPIAGAAALSIARVPSIVVGLDARVASLTFRTERATNLLREPVVARRVSAAGISAFDVPDSTGARTRFETDHVLLHHGDPAIAISTLAAGDSAMVDLSTGGLGSWSITTDRPTGVAVHAEGELELRGPGVPRRVAFLNGDSIGLHFGAEPLTLTFWPSLEADSTIMSDVAVRGLALLSEELRTGGAETETRLTSSVLGGAIRVMDLERPPDTLGVGQPLALDGAAGIVTRVQLTDGGYRVRFEGRARDVRLGAGAAERSLRPSIAGWAFRTHPVLLGGAALAYVAALLALHFRGRRR